MRVVAPLLAAAFLVTPAFAQDSTTPSWDPVAAGRLGVLVDGTWPHSGAAPQGSRQSASDRARATCANKERARARLGAGDPRVSELYRLCAKAGY